MKIRVYPTLALEAKKQGHAATCRAWLLMRHADVDGMGWLSMRGVRGLNIGIGWRRMRQLLASGAGLFWVLDGDRVWLRSPKRVSIELGIERLFGKSVLIPVEQIQKGIGSYNAAVYAAWHAGRRAAPVSRRAVQQATDIPERTQRHYDQVADVRRVVNVSIDDVLTTEGAENHAWKHGNASMTFVDSGGRTFGRNRKVYLSRQLPNSYRTGLTAKRSRRQREYNYVLQTCGLMGRGEQHKHITIFHHSVKDAAREANRANPHIVLWAFKKTRTAQLWSRMGHNPTSKTL